MSKKDDVIDRHVARVLSGEDSRMVLNEAYEAGLSRGQMDFETFRKLKEGKLKPINPNATLGQMAAENGDKPLHFTTVPKSQVEAFNHLADGMRTETAWLGEGLAGTAERVLESLQPGSPELQFQQILHTVESTLEPERPERRDRIVRELIRQKRAANKKKRREVENELVDIDRQRDRLLRMGAALGELQPVLAHPVLQRLGESCVHKLVEALGDGSAMYVGEVDGGGLPSREMLLGGEQIFVVEHDWAKAFEKARDFDGGEVLLPYPDCVFEFRISGKRCVVTIIEKPSADIASIAGETVFAAVFFETTVGWLLCEIYGVVGDVWKSRGALLWKETADSLERVATLVRTQIRAICIALEAEVAQTEIIRAPHRLNEKRARAGKLPIFDYHVVQLSNRKRYAERLPGPADLETESARRRLHFVRGHWRHYANHKIFVKWHLRGGPDLGFIEKEYRL